METLAKAGFIRLRTVSKQVPFTYHSPASICNPSDSHLSCLHGLQTGKFTPIYPYAYDLRYKAVAFVGMLPPCKVFKERLFSCPRACIACAALMGLAPCPLSLALRTVIIIPTIRKNANLSELIFLCKKMYKKPVGMLKTI